MPRYTNDRKPAQGSLLLELLVAPPFLESAHRDTPEFERDPSLVFVLGLLQAQPPTARGPKGAEVSPMLVTVLQLVHETYADPSLSLSALGQQVNLSPRQIERLFRAYLNETFTSYLRRLRVAQAIRLLADSEYQVKAVTAMVGYGAPSLFGRYFRLATGLTPSHFRTQYYLLRASRRADVGICLVPMSESE